MRWGQPDSACSPGAPTTRHSGWPGDGKGLTYARFRTLTSLFSGTGRYTPAQIAERHATVRFTNPDRPVRTLWYALYDTERCTMNVSFYLRDSDHGEISTPQLAFSLQPAPAAAPAPQPTIGGGDGRSHR